MNINKELYKALTRSDDLLVYLSRFVPDEELDVIITVRQDNVAVLDKILYDNPPTALSIVAEWGLATVGFSALLFVVGRVLGVL